MNLIIHNAIRLGHTGPLIEAMNVALDLSTVQGGEVEVFVGAGHINDERGRKTAGFTAGKRTWPTRGPEDPNGGKIVPMAVVESAAVAHALHVCGGNVKQAAAALDTSTKTVYRVRRQAALPTTFETLAANGGA